MPGDPFLFPQFTGPLGNGSNVGFIKADNSVAAAVMTTPLVPQLTGTRAYLQGVRIGGLGATAAAVLTCSISGILGGNMVFYLNIPAGATVPLSVYVFDFPTPIPASAIGGNITVNVPSFGAGNTNAWTIVWGFEADT